MSHASQVSVVIVSRGRQDEVQRCLAALAPQGAGEVIVCDGSAGKAEGPGGLAGPAGPEGPTRQPLEVMREAAVRRAQGDLVLFTEACMEPSATWLSAFVSAHQRWPDAAVIGGTVLPAADLDAVNIGLFLCEYDAFRLTSGAVDAVSAANVSYRPAAIVPLPAPYQWDTLLHHRDAQPRLRQCDAAVTFRGGYRPAEAAAMRFHYGRAFAARRPLSPVQRLVYAAGTPLLPWMLLWRLRRHRTQSDAVAAPFAAPVATSSAQSFVAPLGAWLWALVFLVAWAAGEAVGYIAGAASDERMR